MKANYQGGRGAGPILALLVHIVVVLALTAAYIGADARGLIGYGD